VALKAREALPEVAVRLVAVLQAAVRAAGVPRAARPVALQAVLRAEAAPAAFRVEACPPRAAQVAERVHLVAPHYPRAAYLQPTAAAKVAAAVRAAEAARVVPVPRAAVAAKVAVVLPAVQVEQTVGLVDRRVQRVVARVDAKGQPAAAALVVLL
jgi:hypothetical protein